MTETRRLVVILGADIAGYSRLMGEDEGGTRRQLEAIRAELIDPTISKYNEPPPGGRRGDINRS